MQKRYKCLLFDFDRTIWDVDTNQKSAQKAVYDEYDLSRLCADFDSFYNAYTGINDRLWIEYRDGRVSREYLRNHRFVELLERFGVNDESLASQLSDRYIDIAPEFCKTLPFAREALEYLAPRYPLYIVTNGFREVQSRKLRNCAMECYFKGVITSEDAGANKPDRRIFDLALSVAGVAASDAVMIGDDLYNDIHGASSAGIETIFFNPCGTLHEGSPTREIASLAELADIL